MSFYNIFFSPTGGTKAVSYAVVDGYGCDFEEVDMITERDKFENLKFTGDDFVLVSVPSFGGRIPSPVGEEFRKIKGNRAKAAINAVFGNRAIDDTLTELSDLLEARGFEVVCGMEAVAEHSLVHEIAHGRPDAEDKNQLAEFGRKIREAYEKNAFSDDLKLPGSHNYKKYNGVPMKPYTGSSCIECGLCAKECPAGAIPIDNPRFTDKDLCISCMHCVSICPKHSRRISQVLVSVASVAMKKSCAGRKENKLYI